MAGGFGGGGGVFTTMLEPGPGRGATMGFGIGMGMDSAEKMLRPEPEYSTSSLWASLSKCRAGSMPAFVRRCASFPWTGEVDDGAPDDEPGWAPAGAGWFCGGGAAGTGPESDGEGDSKNM